MESLFFTEEFTVYQQKPQTFIIKFQTDTSILINILLKSKILPPTSMITDNNETLILRASSITNLDDYYKNQYKLLPIAQVKNLKYETDLRIKHDLIKQFIYFLKNHYIFFAFSLKNILVINNTNFIYLSNEYLIKINPTQIPTITFQSPFKREDEDLLISNEIQQINKLPFTLKLNCEEIFGPLLVWGNTGAT